MLSLAMDRTPADHADSIAYRILDVTKKSDFEALLASDLRVYVTRALYLGEAASGRVTLTR